MKLTRKQVIEILEKVDTTVYKELKTITAQALEQAMEDVRKMEVIQQIVGEDVIVKVIENGNDDCN